MLVNDNGAAAKRLVTKLLANIEASKILPISRTSFTLGNFWPKTNSASSCFRLFVDRVGMIQSSCKIEFRIV